MNNFKLPKFIEANLKNQLKFCQCGISGVKVVAGLQSYNTEGMYKWFYGSNIEISNSGMVYHAEIVSLINAINEGYIYPSRIYIHGNHTRQHVPMCLGCRDVYSRVIKNMRIYVIDLGFNIIISTDLSKTVNFPYEYNSILKEYY